MMRFIGCDNLHHSVALIVMILALPQFGRAGEPRPVQRMSFGPRISLENVQHTPGIELPPRTGLISFVTYLRVHSPEELRNIADSHLAVGMQADEVFDILRDHSINPMNIGMSSGSMFAIYGTGRLEDPVLIVRSRRDATRGYRVTEWSTER